MVLTELQKYVIINDHEEKGYSSYKIHKEHPAFNCSRQAIANLLSKYKSTKSIERKKGSGRKVTITTPEVAAEVEELACSQEDQPGTGYSARSIAKHLKISRSSVQRIVKKKQYTSLKRISAPQVKDDARQRRVARAKDLIERFSERDIPKLVWQDESNFTLQVATNRQNNRFYSKVPKHEVDPERLFFEGNRQSKSLMISCIITWHGVTEPFFVSSEPGIKVSGPAYLEHLQKELLPATKRIMKGKKFILIQDSAPSHASNIVQNWLKDNYKTRYVTKLEWPAHSPDANPLDYYFWDKVKTEVYEGRHCRPFKTFEELKARILEVWPRCAADIQIIRKAARQFLPRLEAIVEKDGRSIKQLFG